jgi:hypothetical protein
MSKQRMVLTVKIFIKIIFVVSSLFITSTSFAWNAIGHKVIAQIAYNNLTPDVKKTVDELTSNFRQEYSYVKDFIDLAPWPDSLHAQKISSFNHWHYIDQAFSDDGTPVNNISDTDNVVWALQAIAPVIKNPKANPYERARFLAFYIHLVGDIHQPLHAASRISDAYPLGDHGGNLFLIKNPLAFKATMHLHQLWDEGCGIFVANQDPDNISVIAARLMALYPQNSFGDAILEIVPTNWANESFAIAKNFVYGITENTLPTPEYLTAGQTIAGKQAALAGYRLANRLNSLLAN